MIIPLLFLSCNEDDNYQNFLEHYNNSVWEIEIGDDFFVYIKFNNNDFDPLNYWLYNNDNNCYVYYSFSVEQEMNIVIIENTKDTLIFKSKLSNDEYYSIWTFSESDGGILNKVENFENGISKGAENYILNRSSFKPQNVQICSDN